MILRPLTLFGIIVSMVSGVVLGVVAFWLLDRHFPDTIATAHERTLLEVVERVRDSYYDDVPTSQLVDNAIKGMLEGLDDHSTFLDPTELEGLRAETTGRFGGVGIEIGMVDGYITVISPIDDTPAKRAGLKAGDTIVQLDHNSMKGTKLMDAVDALRGEAGTSVHVRVRRPDDDNSEHDFDLVRATIEVTSVRTRVLEPGYGYLRISQFQDGTAKDMTRAISNLQLETDLKGLVLDLRNNPGGVLRSSVAVADAFLTDGTIVYTQARIPSSELKFTASKDDVLEGAPIVVLINQGSASASEIVAGALQDHGRAILLGTQSYGKGSVQSVLPLENQRAIKLTTARYFTPSGRSIHNEGIVPDVAISTEGVGSSDEYESLLLARALSELKSG